MVRSRHLGNYFSDSYPETVVGIYSRKASILKHFLSSVPYKHVLKSLKGIPKKGYALDLNKDNIADIFWYTEIKDPSGKHPDDISDDYFRLYINVKGNWICRWAELIEECL